MLKTPFGKINMVGVSRSSGERYLCREFIQDKTMLVIGIEDENTAFESERVENGMQYRINDRIDEAATKEWYNKASECIGLEHYF